MKIVAAFLLLLTGAAAADPVRIGTEGFALLPEADVVILGELHDNPAHHDNQALAVAALHPAALVFEMLTPAQALKVTPALRADRAALEKALNWAESGWPDFKFYHPILLAAPGAVIFGGGVPREEARLAVHRGAADVFGGGAAVFGLDMPLDDNQQELREEEQRIAHCQAMPAELMWGMVEAQRLRDAALARAVLAALAETGGPVAVIAGNGHARADWGVPEMLGKAEPSLRVLAVGQLEVAPEPEVAPFHYWLLTDTVPRQDPCAVFDER